MKKYRLEVDGAPAGEVSGNFETLPPDSDASFVEWANKDLLQQVCDASRALHDKLHSAPTYITFKDPARAAAFYMFQQGLIAGSPHDPTLTDAGVEHFLQEGGFSSREEVQAWWDAGCPEGESDA
jgi:hypothetical protein